MIVPDLLRSFAGGEITPELFARVDLVKNQTGLQKALNFIVLPHGPAQNRAGFEYINEVKDSTKPVRIIPFTFNITQTYIIEMGDLYIRFHTGGATLAAAAQNITAITKANPGVLTYTGTDPVNGKWMFLANIGGMTELNGRWVVVANVNTGAKTFELKDTAGNNIDTTNYGTYTAGGTINPVYEIVSPFAAADLFEINFEQNADVLTMTHVLYPPKELKRLGATNWTISDIVFSPAIATPAAPTVATSGASSVTYSYKTTAVATDGFEESYASPATSTTNNLTVGGAFNTITPAAVAGATRYNIYRLDTGGIYGYIGQSDGSSFKDDNLDPDTARTPPIQYIPFNAPGEYPGAISYFEQRRVFGGSINKPQNIWLTRSATESNLSYSIPTQDNDSIVAKLVSRQVNRIRHVVPLLDLLALTPGAEIRVYAQNSDALTPASIANRPQAYVGASAVRPAVTNASVLYVQALGSRIRELVYSWQSSKYNSNDASLMAPHLFDGYTISDMTYSRAPTQILWVVRGDGVMLGLTYVPEQEVMGWHQHNTDGLFKSVACIAEANEEALYAVIERVVNGRTVKYIERKRSQQFATAADAFIVDAGLTYSGTPTKTFRNLWHLEGKTVSILGDAAVFPRKVVTNGMITLEQNVSKANIGLQYIADFQTLPLSVETEAAAQGFTKNINKVLMRVRNSSGIFAGPDFDNLTEVPNRTTENYGVAPALKNGIIDLNVLPSWNTDGALCVRQKDPLPVTIVSMTLIPQIGG